MFYGAFSARIKGSVDLDDKTVQEFQPAIELVYHSAFADAV